MPRTWTTADANRLLREGGEDLAEMLRAPPVDIDPRLAADALVQLLDESVWSFARSYGRLPRPVVKATLEVLATRSDAGGIFIRAYVGAPEDDELGATWAAALQAVRDLNNVVRFGSAKHRAKIEGVASDPRGLEAARAAAASRASDVPDDILGVLVVDGSDTSLDALLPSLDRALAVGDGALDLFVRLEKLAPAQAPRLRGLLEQAEDAKTSRTRTSPVLEVARAIFGDAAPEPLWFSLTLGSVEQTHGNVSRYQAHVRVDPRKASPFVVSIAEVQPMDMPVTSFDLEHVSSDPLGVGRCDPLEVPGFLARSARTLGVTWRWPAALLQSPVRGVKRDRILSWLQGERRESGSTSDGTGRRPASSSQHTATGRRRS